MQCKLNVVFTLCVLKWNWWINFGSVALLLSYGVICSTRWLLPAIQNPAKNKSPTTGCLSTWQFNLYNKSDGDRSEIQRTRLPKLHSLSFAYLSISRTACNWRRGLIWHPPPADYIAFPVTVLCVHMQLPGCTVTNTQPACNFKLLHCGIYMYMYVFTQDSRPAIL